MFRDLLVPVDGSDAAADAAAQAVRFAQPFGARLWFVHVRPLAAGPGGAIEAEAALERAASGARAHGVACECEALIDDDAAAAVTACAQRHGCSLLLVAADMELAQAAPLLLAAKLAVLLVPGQGATLATRTLALLRAEHRALADVLSAWLDHLAAVRGGAAADPARQLAMLRYLESFPAAQHHPKEDHYLFPLLRERCPALGPDLDELERQHERDRALVAELARLTAGLAEGRTDPAELEAAVRAYAGFIWDHLGREEGVILPAAQQALGEAEWARLHAAFGGADARFASSAVAPFRALYSAIQGVAPPAPAH